MNCEGFILVGGRSTRMGQNKALLPFHGLTLAGYIAGQVCRAAGHVSLIGDANTYSYLGYPVIGDIYPGYGPLSGIHAALHASHADWNLVVACDMPEITAEFLESLLSRARQSTMDAVIPAGPTGSPEPLCAVYHRRCTAYIARSLDGGVRKVMDGLAGLKVQVWQIEESKYFRNLNTPEEWHCYSHG